MDSCVVHPRVKDKDGNLVKSKLFEDLLFYTNNNHEEAQEWYAVSHDKKFLDRVGNDADFDQNGEITFNTLRKYSNIKFETSELVQKINKELGAGVYSYEEAIDKLTQFNRESQFKNDFMATIREANGKYALHVVEKTDANQVALHEVIKKRSLRDRLTYELKRRGVEADFTNRTDEGGRYSTENIEKAADGMYHLIRISEGKRMNEHYAEESGHFAVAALNNSPLVQRLLKVLTPEVQKAELGKEYDTAELGAKPEREVAGRLVGKALMNRLGNKTAAQKLVHRVVDLAKRVFASFTANDVLKARLEAQRLADEIAYQYEQGEGTVEDALEIEETLYHKEKSKAVEGFEKVVKDLNLMIHTIKGMYDTKFTESMEEILLAAERSGDKSRVQQISQLGSSELADRAALEGIVSTLLEIIDKIGPGKEITSLLESVDLLDVSNTAIFKEKQVDFARSLRKVQTFVMYAASIRAYLNKNMKKFGGEISNIQLTNEYGAVKTFDLKEVAAAYDTVLQQLTKDLTEKMEAVYLKFCEGIVGKNYIQRSSRLIWSLKAGIKNGFLKEMKAEKISVESLMTNLENDITYFERYIASMSNNSDIMGQIIDKAITLANKKADDLTNQDRERLVALEYKMKQYGYDDLSILMERTREPDEHGYHQFTGNIISDRNTGDWEADRNKWLWGKLKDPNYIKKKDDYLLEYEEDGVTYNYWGQYGEFLKAHAEELKGLSENEKTFMWNDFMHDRWEQWNTDHSERDEETHMWRPNLSYENKKFDYMIFKDKEKGELTDLGKLYIEYMSIKADIDARLPEGSNHPFRAPQFKGRFTEKVKNQSGSKIQRITNTLRGQLHDKYCDTENDEAMWGSELTYNHEEEMLFADELAKEKEKIHRVPLYGINKLKDMSQLSTDLFSSTLAYSNMANTNYALSQVVDMLDVGENVLRGRTFKGREEGDPLRRYFGDTANTRAFTRIQKYLDKQVYGLTAKRVALPISARKTLVLEKVLASISAFGSKYFLGGNVAGGIVNTMTGFNEIFKEALSMEHFTPKELWQAHEWYYANMFKHMGKKGEYNLFSMTGKTFKDDKISLIINHFNVLKHNKEKFRSWKHDRNKGTQFYNAVFNNAIWWPYSMGDHYMNTIPFLSLMAGKKVYTEDGTEVGLYDSYEVGYIQHEDIFDGKEEHDKEDTKRRKLYQKKMYFTTKDGHETYKTIQSIINKLESSRGPLGGTININDRLTSQEKEYLTKRKEMASQKYKDIDRNQYDYDYENQPNRVIRILKMDQEELVWGQKQESDLMDQAQEISIRMHGIYNNIDKTAFNQTWYGGAVLSMRGYALGMMERRFSQSKYSLRNKGESEGSMNTELKAAVAGLFGFSKMFEDEGLSKKELAKKRINYMFNCLAPWATSKFDNTQMLKKRGFSDNQISNMRRHKADIMMAALYFAMYYCSAIPEDKDSKEADLMLGYAHYFGHRLFREQAAFLFPKEMKYEAGALLSYMPAGFAALYDFSTLLYDYFATPFGDTKDSRYYYQRGPNKGRAKAQVKAEKRIPYVRFDYVMEQPYEAEKGIDYVEKKNAR